jgi:hypothetical protein
MVRLSGCLLLIVLLSATLLLGGCSKDEVAKPVESDSAIVGNWIKMAPYPQTITRTLTLKSDHRYESDFTGDGTIDVSGEYSLSGNQITFQDKAGAHACPDMKGMYNFSVAENQLQFSLIKDECKGRAHAILEIWIAEDYQQAIGAYTQRIKSNPGDVPAYFNRARLKAVSQDHEGALRDYNKAIELKPTHAKAFAGRAHIKSLFLQDYEGALRDYDNAIASGPRLENAYVNRGFVRHHLADNEGACSDWKKALELGFLPAEEIIEEYCQ